MSLSEALKGASSIGLMVTGVGLLIVFSVLVILMLAMMLMKVVFYKPETKKAETAAQASKAAPAAAAVQNDMDESELVAVLTAAIAASLNTSTYNLRIKSFRRADNEAPAWNKAGLNDVIGSRF